MTNVKYIYETESDFPDVSFCDLNLFTTKDGLNFYLNKSNEYLNNLSSSITENSSVEQLGSEKLLFMNMLNYINFNFIVLNESIQKSIVNPLEKMLVSCIFNGFPCSLDDFEWFYDSFYSSCYKFNTKIFKNSKSVKSGPGGGLHLEILLGDQQNSTKIGLGNGLHIFISNVIY